MACVPIGKADRGLVMNGYDLTLACARLAKPVNGVRFTAVDKAVLVAVGAYYNPSLGYSFPSVAQITEVAWCDRKTVMDSVARLEQAGILEITRVSGKGNRYRVVIPDDGARPENGTSAEYGTSPECGTGTENGRGTEFGTAPVPNTVPHLSQIRDTKYKDKSKETETTDIRPKLSDTAETVEDFGLEVETLKSEPPTFEEKGVDRTPVKFIVDTYNEVLGEALGKVLKVTPARQQAMRNRYRDIFRDCECLNDEEAKDKVRKFFLCISRSDFLMGRTGRQGNHAAWMPNFDWLMQQKNYTKILEGVYDNGKR